MNLRTRFLIQNCIAVTAAGIAAAAMLLLYFYAYFTLSPQTHSLKPLPGEMITLQGDSVSHFSTGLDIVAAEKAYAAFNEGKAVFTHNGAAYLMDYAAVDNANAMLRLTPVMDRAGFYIAALIIAGVVFSAVFLFISNFYAARIQQAIIEPIQTLTAITGKIAAGNLDSEIPSIGDYEIKELAQSLELMRVKLKDIVYLQRRYDENRRFLVSALSHDLRTPVTIIKGYLEGLIDGVAEKREKREKYLQTALAKTNMLNGMIDDLLLYSKLELNQMPFHCEKISISAYMEDIASEYAAVYAREQKGLKYSDLTNGRAVVNIDTKQFTRVAQNIIDNAKRHIATETGYLNVILRESAQAVIIEFKDNGGGVDDSDLPQVFDRFYRSDKSRKNSGGSGLGLAISKQITEGMGGRVWAVNNEAGGFSVMVSLSKCR